MADPQEPRPSLRWLLCQFGRSRSNCMGIDREFQKIGNDEGWAVRLTPKTCPSPRVSMLNVVVPSGLCMPMINGDFSLSQIARAYVGRSAKHSNRLSRSLKVIGTDTDRSATYDFLLVIRSNHGPILCRFRDKSCENIKFLYL